MPAPRAGSAESRERFPWLWRGCATLLVLIAFGTRAYRLDAQSLWYDEGLSVALAGRDLVTIARNAADDIHPPLYYAALAAWTHLVGSGAFAARFLSLIAGTSLVALTWAIGRRLWSRSVALSACLLAAFSPYLIWYSQEARMYMLVAVLGAAALWLTLDLSVDRPKSPRHGSGRWLALLGLEVASLYSHYVGGATIVLAVNLTAALSRRGWRRRWAHGGRRLGTSLGAAKACPRRAPLPPMAPPSPGGASRQAAWLWHWIGLQLAALLLFAPWLRLAWPTLAQWPATSEPFSLSWALAEALRVFALGARRPELGAAWPWLWAATLAIGLARPGRSGQWSGPLVALTWVALPPLGLWLAGLSRPAWEAKQLISGALGFELLAAAGVVHAARWASGSLRGAWRRRSPTAPVTGSGAVRFAVAAGAIVAALGVPRLESLVAVWHHARLQRDDYRGLAQTVASLAGPRDAVLLNAPTQIEVFEYYDRRAHPTYPLPRSRPPDRAATELELSSIAARHRDLFAVLWATDQSDPEGIVEQWLNRRRYKVFDRWFGNVRLALWAAAREPLRPLALAEGVQFDGQLRLCRLACSPLVVQGGETLTLAAQWQALRRPQADYVVFVQLLDAAGALAAQRDMPPVGGSARTSQWSADVSPGPSLCATESRSTEEATTASAAEAAATGQRTGAGDTSRLDLIGLRLPNDLAPGRYTLIMGLYDPSTGRRLIPDSPAEPSASRRDALTLGSLIVH